MSPQNDPTDPHALNQFRDYLRILASQQLASRFQGKVDLSGVVQETLWDAHREMARGVQVSSEKRLPWLRRILSNNMADAVRRMTAGKRSIQREMSLQQSIEHSSVRLEAWLSREMPPERDMEREDRLLQLVGALTKLPDAQRESLVLHYCTGWTLIADFGAFRSLARGHRGIDQTRPATTSHGVGPQGFEP